MTQLFNFPLDTNLAGLLSLQANGTTVTGNASPAGIQERVQIVDGTARLSSYGSDAETNFGYRSEIAFGRFPNSGEVWSSVDFMIDPLWTTSTVASIGSWYPSPDGGEESIIKHVNIGLRLVDKDTLFVNVPAAVLPAISATGKTVAVKKIEQGRWYNITIRMNLQTTAVGWREVYLDRVKIFGEYNVPTAYDDANGPYFKMGPRTPLSHDYDMVRMWVRNAKQWFGNESFSTIMGGVPVSSGRMLQQ
ncbi:Polysaccharide lyase [Nitrosospira multiformis]|uniref:Polysaccharide lyase n=1 Tax=Nitrosospira multiformis TaxID=1231 RepID=A0A1H8AVA8_9PROT|nr:heparin lyase I family protein [Nitrosospira multiformis]SEM74625.1 Polysaccharide lyase [Nitrosospira multiformis]